MASSGTSSDDDEVEQFASQLEAQWSGEQVGASAGGHAKLEKLASRLNLDDTFMNNPKLDKNK